MTKTTEVTMTQPKMTQAERRMVLAAHERLGKGSALSSKGTHWKTIFGAQDKGFLGEGYNVTMAGLRAAGVDLDAIYEEASDVDAALTLMGRSPEELRIIEQAERDRAHEEASAENAQRAAAPESLTPTLDERAAFIASIRPGSRVVVRHGGRELAGQVTSTAAQGVRLLSIGFYARELGPNRIDDAICVEPVDILRSAPSDGTCGVRWVAEIAHCPRCGLDAAAHAHIPSIA